MLDGLRVYRVRTSNYQSGATNKTVELKLLCSICCCLVTKSCLTLRDPWTVASQDSLSFTVSQSLLKFTPMESEQESCPWNHQQARKSGPWNHQQAREYWVSQSVGNKSGDILFPKYKTWVEARAPQIKAVTMKWEKVQKRHRRG